MTEGSLDQETLLQHLGEEEKPHGAVVPPIYQNSLFTFKDFERFQSGFNWGASEEFVYSRLSNPTLRVVEEKLAMLEKTESALLFSSGMAAVSSAILSQVSAGDHVVAVDVLYGPTFGFLKNYLPRLGVETTFADGRDPEKVREATQDNTKLVVLESPGSYTMRLQDLQAISAIAKERSITTMIDNSYASPIFQTPVDFGIDLVVHSATKYIGGHSDVVAGAICASKKQISRLRAEELQYLGGSISPHAAWLLMRGLRTLPMRMKRHEATANHVAEYLLTREDLNGVFHVSLPNNPQAELYKKQMKGAGGLLSFLPPTQNREWVKAFCEALELFAMGVSWGGFESLCVPVKAKPLDWDRPQWVVRLYCGLEDPEDLVADLKQAFAKASGSG
jgi:cystathionine beta-lyase